MPASTYLTDEADALDPYAPLLGDGVQHRRHPIRGLDVPSAEALTGILDEVDDHLRADRVVYVHCWDGIGRTGTVVGRHLVRHGLTAQEAMAETARLREGTPDAARVAPETEAWRNLVLGWREKSLPYRVSTGPGPRPPSLAWTSSIGRTYPPRLCGVRWR